MSDKSKFQIALEEGLSKGFPDFYPYKIKSGEKIDVNNDYILELSLISFIFWGRKDVENILNICEKNNIDDHFINVECLKFYQIYKDNYLTKSDLEILQLMLESNYENSDYENSEKLVTDILRKKLNLDRPEKHVKEYIGRILDRDWMNSREEIRLLISSGKHSDETFTFLCKAFYALKENPPKLRE